jgi:hypothetical protein
MPLIETPESKWESAKSKTAAIVQAMLDETILTPLPAPIIKYVEDKAKIIALTDRLTTEIELKNAKNEEFIHFKNWIIFVGGVAILSIFLWTFHLIIHWHWLEGHPRKVGIYISFQMVIIFAMLPIAPFEKWDKKIDFIIAILGAITCAVLSII